MTGWLARFCALSFALLLSSSAAAHGIVGPRFFPATLSSDDPFAADELALPTISSFKHLDDGATVTETDYSMEYSKTLWRGVAVAFGDSVIHAASKSGPTVSGFDNLEVTPLVELARAPQSEFILTAGLSWEIGGTGSKSVAEARSRYTPELLFGKGFGDLPDSMALLRPFAVTATLGYGISGRGDEPHTLEWAGAVEYSLAYLQTNVRDVGLGPVASRITPVVEFALSSPLDRGGGETTGTIDPGLIWSGQYVQLAAEATIPVNNSTGSNVGFIAQLHFYIDDIFPLSLGTPLFGGHR